MVEQALFKYIYVQKSQPCYFENNKETATRDHDESVARVPHSFATSTSGYEVQTSPVLLSTAPAADTQFIFTLNAFFWVQMRMMMMRGFVERVINSPQTCCQSAKQVGLQILSERQRGESCSSQSGW